MSHASTSLNLPSLQNTASSSSSSSSSTTTTTTASSSGGVRSKSPRGGSSTATNSTPPTNNTNALGPTLTSMPLPLPEGVRHRAASCLHTLLLSFRDLNVNNNNNSPTSASSSSSSAEEGPSEEEYEEAIRNALTSKRNLQSCARAFNAKPKRGVEAMVGSALVPSSPPAALHWGVAHILLCHAASGGFDPVAIGEYLGGGDTPDDDAKRRAHVNAFMESQLQQRRGGGGGDSHGPPPPQRSLLEALRLYLRTFRLPGEAQQIDRILQAFAGVAHTSCSEGSLLASIDATYLLSFSIIMLNTDLHNPNIRADRKMSEDAFVRNNEFYGEDISHGRRIPGHVLRGIYRNIRRHPIAPPVSSFSLIPQLSPALDAPSSVAGNATLASSFVGLGDALQLDDMHRLNARVGLLRPPTPPLSLVPCSQEGSRTASPSRGLARRCAGCPQLL